MERRQDQHDSFPAASRDSFVDLSVKHHKCMILGLEILFPQEPYPQQKEYMQKLIKALRYKENGLLESPTGTGKTQSLLCASLAWLHLEADPRNKIIFTSRTHTQLNQVLKSLGKLAYRPRTVCLASRDHLCVNESISRAKTQNLINACKNLRKEHKCQYFSNLEKRGVQAFDKIPDLQDFKTHAKAQEICPYYAARRKMKDAELILMPYNYLINPSIRRTLEFDFSNTVVIIDEAHNIINAAEEAFSIEMSLFSLKSALKDIQLLSLKKSINEEAQNWVRRTLQAFCSYLHNYPSNFREPNTTAGGYSLPGFQIRSLIERITSAAQSSQQHSSLKIRPIKPVNQKTFPKYLEALYYCLSECSKIKSAADGLQVWVNFMKLIFQDLQHKQALKSSEIHIYESEEKGKMFSFMCFTAQGCFAQIKDLNLHSLVLTSGTMRPLDPWNEFLGLEFPHTVQCTHVIEQRQVSVQILGGNFAYEKRNEKEEMKKLGTILINSMGSAIGGVLIFFSSYGMLQLYQNQWERDGTMQIMKKYKSLFFEDRETEIAIEAMKDYEAQIRRSKQGVLFAVLRGKASQGLNFVNDLARMVIVVGLPYANKFEAKIELKMKHLDRAVSQGRGAVKGWDWYEEDAVRAVNQAAGRIIRHKEDFGTIVLIDERYKKEQIRSKLSKWMEDRIEYPKSQTEYLTNLDNFFKQNEDLLQLARQRSEMRKKELQEQYGTARKKPIKVHIKQNRSQRYQDSPPKRLDSLPRRQSRKVSSDQEEKKSYGIKKAPSVKSVVQNLEKRGLGSLAPLFLEKEVEEKKYIQEAIQKEKIQIHKMKEPQEECEKAEIQEKKKEKEEQSQKGEPVRVSKYQEYLDLF